MVNGTRKKIFIAIQYVEIGGAERALIGLLNSINYNKYEIDLFVYRHSGAFMPLIPQKVNLLPENSCYAAILKPIKSIFIRHPLIAIGRLLAKKDYKKNKKRRKCPQKDDIRVYHHIAERLTPVLPEINPSVNYDLAISFLIPHQYILRKVNAKQKWAWVHTDYSSVLIDKERELPIWNGYDKIISISDDVSKGFLATFPSLKDKIIIIENILSSAYIRQQANESIPPLQAKDDEVKLLSVGRFCYPKAFDRAVWICKSLIDMGLKIKWFIIGYGDESIIQNAIQETGMHEYFIILGKKSNPYPFMKACDIYVQPSRYEGKAVTVREAQILCKPVAITDYPTAASQIKNGIDGIIVPNEINGAAEGLKKIIENKQLQIKLIKYLQEHDYGMENEVKKMYKILGYD